MKVLKTLLSVSFVALVAAGPALADLTLEEKAAADRALELAAAGYTEEWCQKRVVLMTAFTTAVKTGDKASIGETGRTLDAFHTKSEAEAEAVKAAFDAAFKDDAPAVIALMNELVAAAHPCDK